MWGLEQPRVLGVQLLVLVLLTGSCLVAEAIQLQTCIDGFVVHRDKIIRTEDSLKLGAVYLAEYEVSSKIECIKWCCETERCDVFVYEERKLGGCYLFHCGPPHDFKCKFTNHVNYSSAVLTNYNLQSADAIDELKSLRKSEPVTASSPSTTTTTTSTTTSSTTVSPATSSEPVKLRLQSSQCSRNQFECRSSEDCIAIYNVCDGIPQCADGSDEALELGCPQEQQRTTLPPQPPPPPPPQQSQQSQQPQQQHARPHHQQQSQSGPVLGLPDLIGYQQMMQHQHQQYPMRLYPPEGPPQAFNQAENVNNGWSNSYQPRGGYAVPAAQQPQPPPANEPPPNEAPLPQQHQVIQAPVNYDQWQGGPPLAPAAPANRWPSTLDEQKLAMAHANHANAFQPPNPDNYPPQQQMPHIFNHKTAGVRLDELETANGLYGQQDPSRGYAPYYPAVIRHPESSWQEASNDNLPPASPPQQQRPAQPNNHRQALVAATAGPPGENVPYQQEPKLAQRQQQHATTSTTPPPCDSSENRQSDDQQRLQHVKSSDAAESGQSKGGAEHAHEHKAHELELKTVAQAHLQEHKSSIAIVDHLGRAGAGHVSPRIEELEMSRPKGAVISLALGLSVTAIMAVLIACRLRVVKRRGRGRSHDSYAHDTDYLVNGMYL